MVINLEQIFLAALLALFVGGTAGYVGSLMLIKRMSLVGDALGHLALPGVTLALLYHFDVGWGALIFLALGVTIIWLLQRKTGLELDVLTGVMFSTSLAISFLILPAKEMDIALLGNVQDISFKMVFWGIIAACSIFALMHSIVRSVMLAQISEDLARTSGYNVTRNTFLYMISIGLTVALGIRIIGALMTAALVTIPAAASANMCRTFTRYLFMSMIIGATSSACGVIMSFFTGQPAGALVVLTSTLFFLFSFFFIPTAR